MNIELELVCSNCGKELRHNVMLSEGNDAENTAEHTIRVEPCEACADQKVGGI